MKITEFLAPFFHDDEIIYGRAIAAKKFKASTIPFSFTREQLASDKSLQANLKEWNKTRGIYYIVNAGGNSDAEISRINAAFCEIDNLSIEEQHDIFDNALLPPSIRVDTKQSVHAYWLLNEFITANDFIFLQRGLIEKFNSDRSLFNPSRLMRIPLFNHVAFDENTNALSYKQVQVHTFNADTRFSLAELSETFPFELPPPVTFSKVTKDSGDFDEVTEELKLRIMSTKMFRRHGDWGHTRGICHNGEGDTGLYIHFPTGAVKCFSACSWKRIVESFGINLRGKK